MLLTDKRIQRKQGVFKKRKCPFCGHNLISTSNTNLKYCHNCKKLSK